MAQHPDKVTVTLSIDHHLTPKAAVLTALAEVTDPTAVAVADLLGWRVQPAFVGLEQVLSAGDAPLAQLVEHVAWNAYGRQDEDYLDRAAWAGIRGELVEAGATILAAIELIDTQAAAHDETSQGGEH